MSLDEILWCGCSNETSFAVSSHGAIQTHTMESHNNFPGEEGVKGQIFKMRMRLYFTGLDVECHGGGWRVELVKLHGGGGGIVHGAWIFSRVTHYHKGSLGLSHMWNMCFEVAHIMNWNFLVMYLLSYIDAKCKVFGSLRFVKKCVIWYEF